MEIKNDWQSELKSYLKKFEPVKNEVLDEYLAHWRPYSLPRRTIMTAPGETQRYLYFVLEGVQKAYYLNDDKQHITTFAYAPSFSGILESFFTQTPSQYFLETITACQFVRISYDQHQMLLKNHRPIETLFRKATERFLLGVLTRQHELMAFDMETRFKVFVKRSGHLLNMVSQKDLASYLRMDATNFSKMMNNIKV